MGDPFAEDRILHVFRIGVHPVVIAGQTCKQHQIGLGDSASGADERVSNCVVLVIGSFQDRLSFTSCAISVGSFAILTPTAWSAAIFSCAVPSPPLIIAPACPMRLPGGAAWPAIKLTT